MSYFRYYFCEVGTEDTLCMVPIDGGEDFESEDAWCLDMYDSTRCTDVRDAAQTRMQFAMISYYTVVGAVACALLFLMLCMINSLERIISKPIVQKS